MSQIVRRHNELAEVSDSAQLKPVLTHRGDGVSVSSQLYIGPRPELYLSWNIEKQYLYQGFTLMVFHSTSGFCPEARPDDLSKHGNLIIETQEDGERSLYPDEGAQYFTFVFRKKPGILGFLGEKRSHPLRFSEMIPSAKVVLSRVKDRLELREQDHRMNMQPKRHEIERNELDIALFESAERLEKLRNPPPLPEPQQPPSSDRRNDLVIDQELGAINRLIDTVLASETAFDDLQHDPRFQRLSNKSKKKILQQMRRQLDLAEITAREERRRR